MMRLVFFLETYTLRNAIILILHFEVVLCSFWLRSLHSERKGR
jgi:hypothetical protein